MDRLTDLTVTFEQNGLALSARVRPTPADFARLCGDSLSSGIAFWPCPDDLADLLRDVAAAFQPKLYQAQRELSSAILSALDALPQEQNAPIVHAGRGSRKDQRLKTTPSSGKKLSESPRRSSRTSARR